MNKIYNLTNSDALLVTDMQIDFLPGGRLPVADADKIIPILNGYIDYFEKAKAHIIASRDWHPTNHVSFKEQGGQWPSHCVQNSIGAQFSPDIKLPAHTVVISKATDPNREAYSAFAETNLEIELSKLCVKRFFVGGLATDYCVVNTVLDACALGYETVVLVDAIMGIDLQAGDVDRAIKSMVDKGALVATIENFQDLRTLPLKKR